MPKEISFKISRLQFWAVALLILLLPLSSKYKLIIWGEKTIGNVVDHKKVNSGRLSEYDTYSVIQFKADSVLVRMYGPENTIYEIGDSIAVFYKKDNPRNCMILAFAHIYTGQSAIIPFVLLLVWIAFYTAFKEKNEVKSTSSKNQKLLKHSF